MTEDETNLVAAVDLVREFEPKYSLKMKVNDKLQSLIGRFLALIGNKAYMAEYWTTFGDVTYRPAMCARGPAPSEWAVILHEGAHVLDWKRHGKLKFALAYLFPQVLALPLLGLPLLLGAGFWALLALLLLAPLPAPFRTVLEMHGYRVSVLADAYGPSRGLVLADKVGYLDAYVLPHFTTGAYYWMWPFKAALRRRFLTWIDSTADLDEYGVRCLKFVQTL